YRRSGEDTVNVHDSTETTDPERLPTGVLPSAYRLRLDPDLDSATFEGAVEIDVEVLHPTSTVVLHAHELEIAPATERDAKGEEQRGGVELDGEHQRATLTFPKVLEAGRHTLGLRFTGVLNDELAGFYRSTFEDEDGTTRTIATTQFEMTDARRAFPCFDEPAFKSTFEVSLVVPAGMAAFSNTAPVREQPLDDGRREVGFAPTMKMSSYLLAFVVGPFEQTPAVDVDGVPLSVVYRKGQEHLTRFALEVGAFALRTFEQYFQLPYPGDKVDFVGIPDFAPGAMENLGCVMFREVELLVDPATASQNELVRIAVVIAHELAHMWFGDLVTMSWWEGLWLNEAFATFMQFICVDQFRPEWKMWVRFAAERETGMALDSVHTTRPIEFPVRSPGEALAMADPITYQKGSGVLRMLEQYLSPETFRDGIRHYLRAHAYGNTVTSDLWASLEVVSGRPVGEIMSSWIYQGGHPVVSVDSSSLAQRPFMLGATEGDSAIGTHWLVPVVERSLESGSTAVQLLHEDRAPLEIAPPVLVNAAGAGVYRTSYAPEQLAAVVARLDALSEVERAVLVADTVALTYAGDRTVADVLAIASNLGERVEPVVWETVDRVLGFLERIVTDEQRPRLASKVRDLMGPVFDTLGWVRCPGEDERTQVLRATLVRRLGTTGDDAGVREEAVRRFDEDEVGGDLATAVVDVVASANRPGDYDEMIRRIRAARDPQTERRYQGGIAAFTDPSIVMRAYAELFETFRSQDAPVVLARLIGNRVAGLEVWSALADHWEEVIERIPMSMQSFIGLGFFFQVADTDVVAKVTEFHRTHPLPAGQRLTEQGLEWFAASSRLAARELPTLDATLAAGGQIDFA
ncbi:MAG: M1 family aminopeptidase, partial [Acidimicrobiales bacterium]